MRIFGVDFTSAPRSAKPITVAYGTLAGRRLRIARIDRLADFTAFEALLRMPGPWTAGFDFPFGLPRDAVRTLGWPQDWAALALHCRAIGRRAFTQASDRLRRSRPPGERYAKRRGDDAAGSHSPLKCVNPPVGWMFLEGASRLVEAGVHVPGMRAGDPDRVALEAYPGFVARRIVGRASYKSDRAAHFHAARRRTRAKLLAGLANDAAMLGITLDFEGGLLPRVRTEASGDLLDAAICALQSAWAWRRRADGWGLPRSMDPLEGWIAAVAPLSGAGACVSPDAARGAPGCFGRGIAL